ncbi:hypothetical protein [Microbacterium marinilacus]|uniref:DUF7847 domain-containing protein n=1 Tax=Microbacterium marinilacus TaxID=415209 RepID=A0ABP7B8N6_9MICO|nr:hypothetical protein [Microbacterium marinilacus]MBY0687227.1 hypothetical protein [Microbacterium marinilacus]
MSQTTTWRPAPRPGLVPLYPFGFGTALGRAFSALRGNPKVLLGFAVGVQALASFVGVVVIGAVTALSFSRLDTVDRYSDAYDAILAGSTALSIVVTLVVTLALTALSVIVQGLVVAEVSRAVVGERGTLRMLWSMVRPAFWRLTGYFALQLAAVLLATAIVVSPVLIAAATGQWGLAFIALPLLLGMIPLWLWLGTKLYLVPSAIVLEHAGPIAGIRRSWTLTIGRFWPTFGVMVLISLIMGIASSLASSPLQLVSTFLPAVLWPLGTSGSDAAPAVAVTIALSLLGAALQLLVSAIGTIVSGTGGALMYVDARMRREGLDLRLQAYVEQRELGSTAQADPWAYDPSHAAPARPYGATPLHPEYPAYPGPQGYPHQPGYPSPAPQGYPAQPGYPPAQPGYPPAPSGYPPASPQAQPASPPAPPAYAAPGQVPPHSAPTPYPSAPFPPVQSPYLPPPASAAGSAGGADAPAPGPDSSSGSDGGS